jgi:hypothetical protein
MHVDICATTVQPASTTARSVREVLLTSIVAHQLVPGDVTVTVIRLEP